MNPKNNIAEKTRDSIRKFIEGFHETPNLTTDIIPNSLIFTKLELEIHYGNLILIEDMKIENSNNFMRANGFLSRDIKLSSLEHDPLFDMSSCVFRIYPKTYNVNKYKVLDYINTRSQNSNPEELHFKFSGEMFTNLDIVQNKFDEPVRFGDIIMLMHENTGMFVKFLPQTNKVTLSNHDSEAALFSIESASEIMLNDNQIVTTGRPIKLKIAWFAYANSNLFFGIRFPYFNELEGNKKERNLKSSQSNKENKKDREEKININEQRNNDKDKKENLINPEIIIEENSTMRWRMLLYCPYTNNEKLLLSGSLVQFYHCFSNSIITLSDIKSEREKSEYISPSVSSKGRSSKGSKDDEMNSIVNLIDSDFSLIHDKSFSELNKDEFSIPMIGINPKFYLKNILSLSNSEDVNSIWILESIFPLMKKQFFLRYYEDKKIDTYRMMFRIKHFKTNKILTIRPIDLDDAKQSKDNEDDLYKKGYLKGGDSNIGKLYRFDLVDDKPGKLTENEENLLDEEYQYSLFAFGKAIKSETFYSQRPVENDFLRLYHVETQSYLKIIPQVKKLESHFLSVNDLMECELSLTKHPEEREIFKIILIDANSKWKYSFLKSLYSPLQAINLHLEDTYMHLVSGEEKKEIIFSKFQMIRYILKKLLMFVMNKFVNKFSSEYGFNTVVKERQILISNFGFSHIILNKIIYNYWLHDGTLKKLIRLNKILFKLSKSGEGLGYINKIDNDDKYLYVMYKYTELIFDFCIVYCKDNIQIKSELYEYLDVYFYFFNIIESCLDGMSEIFKNNPKILHCILRDCEQKENFKKALKNIFKAFFFNLADNEDKILPSQDNQNINLIDLIFCYIKISKYSFKYYNNVQAKRKERKRSDGISLISKEKYFSLLNSMVIIKDGTNIIENQRYIIDKIITTEKNNEDNLIISTFLDVEEDKDYPPSLNEMLCNIAEHNPNEKIQKFLAKNEKFKIEKLLPNVNLKIDQIELTSNIKLIIYLISAFSDNKKTNDSEDIENRKNFIKNIMRFYKFQTDYFLNTFFVNSMWQIDFLSKKQVNLVISTLQFLKVIDDNHIVELRKENKLIVDLMHFLTRNYNISDEKKTSNLIHSEMNKKLRMLSDRIVKFSNSSYIIIAQSWYKVYLVLKTLLAKMVENENNQLSEEKTRPPYLSTLKKAIPSKIIAKKISKKKSSHKDNDQTDKDETYNQKETETTTSFLNGKITHKFVQKRTSVMVLSKNKPITHNHSENEIKIGNVNYEMNMGNLKNGENINRIHNQFYERSDLVDDKGDLDDDESLSRESTPIQGKNYTHKKKDSIKMQGNTINKTSIIEPLNNFNQEDYEDITKVITSEDEKTLSKNEISKNILSIFSLIINNNITILKNNFYDYYHNANLDNYYQKIKFDDGEKNKFDDLFDDFVYHCFPNLDSGIDSVNKMIRQYGEKKFKSRVNISDLSNFNVEFNDKRNKNLNFIHNLIIAFNTTDDLEMEEAILSLIYHYFSQRKKFIKCVTLFNEHIIEFRDVKEGIFNDKDKIKRRFEKFYQEYEKIKFEFSEKNLNEVDNFFSLLMGNLLVIFKKILNFWKFEFRTLCLVNPNKYEKNFDKNENLIKEFEKFISCINKLKEKLTDKKVEFTEKVYLSFIEEVLKMYYFIRKNANNNIFLSLISILDESEILHKKKFYALMTDFINKVKRFSLKFTVQIDNNKNEDNMQGDEKQKILSIKNKFFSCFLLLITFMFSTLQRTVKNSKFLYQILINERELMKYDSICNFLILLYVSDIQKQFLCLNYFPILEIIKTLTESECFGTFNTKVNLRNAYPLSFCILYLDIMLNVLKFVVNKKNIINEQNLDEILVSNILFLIKKCNHDYEFSKEDAKNLMKKDDEAIEKREFLVKLIRVMNFFNEVPTLYNLFLFKIDPKKKTNFDNELSQLIALSSNSISKDGLSNDDLPITDYFPLPEQLYYLFCIEFSNIFDEDLEQSDNILNSIKSSYELFKYFIFFIIMIDNLDIKLNEFVLSDRSEWVYIKMLIHLVISGSYEKKFNIRVRDFENLEDFLNFDDGRQFNIMKFLNSSFFLLLNQFVYEVFGEEKKINQLLQMSDNQETGLPEKIRRRLTINSKKEKETFSLSEEQLPKEEEELKLDGFKFYMKTTENLKVNYYIAKKIKHILKTGYYVENYSYYKKELHKHYIEKEYVFKEMLFENRKKLQNLINKEKGSLIFYLLNLLESNTKIQYDQIFYTFLNKIGEFMHKTCNLDLSLKTIKLNGYFLFILKELIKFFEKNEDKLNTSLLRKKTLQEMQILLEKTGIIKITLNIVLRFHDPEIKEILPSVFTLYCKLLKKGNLNSQEAFYDLFIIPNQYEPIFDFMLNLISSKINYIESNKSKILRHKKKKVSLKNIVIFDNNDNKLDSKILQFLQLLCENHNQKLQLFLHSQSNFRKSYDLVSQTQHYLTIIFNHFEPFLFEPLIKCFDLLIEFIQGPCLENQLALINSKVLITINDIIKYYIHCESAELYNQFPDVEGFKMPESEKIGNNIHEEEDIQLELNFYKMSTKQISLLTFKSSILLLALVESRTKEDPIYEIIKNMIKEETLQKICYKIYFEYLSTICKTNELDDYVLRLSYFNRAENINKIDIMSAKEVVIKKRNLFKKKPTDVEDYLILETGFFFYFLLLYFKDYEQNKNYDENLNPINRGQKTKEKTIFDKINAYIKNTIISSLYIFSIDFTIACMTTLSLLISGIIFACTLGRVRVFNLLRKLLKHNKYNDADSWVFYRKYTRSIEILRDEKVYKIYFYIFPYCNNLNKFEKLLFLEGIDRTNSKSKLMDIIKFANKLKFELENDYYVKNFLRYLPICGVIFKSVELWKDLSLLLTIIQNLFNILAVYKVGKSVTMCIKPQDCAQLIYWSDEKSYFYMTAEDFKQIIGICAYVQCGLAFLIYIEFMCRKVPTIYSITEEKISGKKVSNTMRNFLFLKNFLFSLIFNFEVLYYSGYVALAFVGTFNSDFFFSFLLLEVVQRFKTLRNVLMAFQSPYKEVFLTFILWIIIIYFFSIAGYLWFRKDFPNYHDCSSLARCLATLFYENLKMDNGIGGYLTSIYLFNKSKNPFIGRFWFDELSNLILKILVIQMIFGIIIDTFKVLRVKEVEMVNDMKNVCTICSLQKEVIGKIYDKFGLSYADHIGQDHRIFNYIFYIIYLYKKDITEFTGNESYVYELAFNQKDINWFPTGKIYYAKEDELQFIEENEDED